MNQNQSYRLSYGASSVSPTTRASFHHYRPDDDKKDIDTQILRKTELATLRKLGPRNHRTSSKHKPPLDDAPPLLVLPTFRKDGTYRGYQSYSATQAQDFVSAGKSQNVVVGQLLLWLSNQEMLRSFLNNLVRVVVNDALTFARLSGRGISSSDLSNGTAVMGQVKCNTDFANLYHHTIGKRGTGNTLTILYVCYTVGGTSVACVIGFAQHARGHNVDKTEYDILVWDPNYTLTEIGSRITLKANSSMAYHLNKAPNGKVFYRNGRYFNGR